MRSFAAHRYSPRWSRALCGTRHSLRYLLVEMLGRGGKQEEVPEAGAQDVGGGGGKNQSESPPALYSLSTGRIRWRGDVG